MQTAENALNSPSVGWVITTSSSAKIEPPPTAMSLVEVSPSGTGALEDGSGAADEAGALGGVLDAASLGVLEAELELEPVAVPGSSSLPHAASSGRPTPAAASPVRVLRENAAVDGLSWRRVPLGASCRAAQVVEIDTTDATRAVHEVVM